MLDLSSSNSLLELGVGLNLAYSWVRVLRTYITDLFIASINQRSKSLLATVKDLIRGNETGDFVNNNRLILDDCERKRSEIYRDFELGLEELNPYSVKYAVATAFLLLGLTVVAAIFPKYQVGNLFPLVILAIALGPLLATLFAQFIVYFKGLVGFRKLIKRLIEFKRLAVEFSSDIIPQVPKKEADDDHET